MSKLRLSMACWNYDRTRALLEDRIPIDGIDLNVWDFGVDATKTDTHAADAPEAPEKP